MLLFGLVLVFLTLLSTAEGYCGVSFLDLGWVFGFCLVCCVCDILVFVWLRVVC